MEKELSKGKLEDMRRNKRRKRRRVERKKRKKSKTEEESAGRRIEGKREEPERIRGERE